MADDTTRILELDTSSEVATGDYIVIDSFGAGSRKYDIGQTIDNLRAGVASAESSARSAAQTANNVSDTVLLSGLSSESDGDGNVTLYINWVNPPTE